MAKNPSKLFAEMLDNIHTLFYGDMFVGQSNCSTI